MEESECDYGGGHLSVADALWLVGNPNDSELERMMVNHMAHCPSCSNLFFDAYRTELVANPPKALSIKD